MPEADWLARLKELSDAIVNGTELPAWGDDDEAETPMPRLQLIRGGRDDA